MEWRTNMKYIRTKDKIIDLTSKQVSSYEIVDDKKAINEYGEDSGFIMVYYYDEDIGEHLEHDGKGGRSMDNWYLKDIIKQADTIEELCDEFVAYHKTLKLTYVIRKMPFVEQDENFNIYGAIWTEWGLKYVAKMKGILPNGEREWELL